MLVFICINFLVKKFLLHLNYYLLNLLNIPTLICYVNYLFLFLQNQLSNFPTACDLIGHLLVLSQMVWPQGKEIAEDMCRLIAKLPVFSYPQFSSYITNIDIIEEFMAMYMENNKCVLNIFPCVATSLR